MNKETLYNKCQIFHKDIDDGINWIKNNIDENDSQKYELIKSLEKNRRKIKRLEKASISRPCIAFFGESQAGKSYLVSNFITEPGKDIRGIVVENSNEERFKECFIEPNIVDFIKWINPEGNGRESTGLVTRFTVENKVKTGEKPFLLKLLTQSDIVKVLANGYLSDIEKASRKDQVTIELIEKIDEIIKLKSKSEEIGGISEDEIYDIKEYLHETFYDPLLIELDKYGYWEKISTSIKFLDIEDRCYIFEILWGKNVVLSDIFRKMSYALKELNFPTEVRCGLEALVPKTIEKEVYDSSKGEKIKKNVECSIIDVEVLLHYLHKDSDDFEGCKVFAENGKNSIVRKSILSALVSEIEIVIPKKLLEYNTREFLKEADILDFPGARARLNISANNSESKTIVTIFLRGKVAYLFDKYNKEHEISSLLLCLRPDTPLNVKSLAPLTRDWINLTHGINFEERQKLKSSSLFVVFTRFNSELSSIGDENQRWNRILESNFEKEMLQATEGDENSWLKSWDGKNKPFNNCYLVRDPLFSTEIFEGVNKFDKTGIEKSIREEYVKVLQEKKSVFVKHPLVKRYISNPDKLWEEAANIGNTGLNYIAENLVNTSKFDIKLDKINFQILKIAENTFEKLSAHYIGGDFAEVSLRIQEEAIKIKQEFLNLTNINKKNFIGKLIENLKVNEETAEAVLYSVINFRCEENDIDTGWLSGESISEFSKNSVEKQFAQELISKWISNMEEIKNNDFLLKQVLISKETFNTLLREFSIGADRVNLSEVISLAVKNEIKKYAKNKNSETIARIATIKMNKFINTLGYALVKDEEKPNIEKFKEKYGINLFENEIKKFPEKDNINLDMPIPANKIFAEWFFGIEEFMKENIKYRFNCKTFNSNSNAELGKILNRIKELNS